MSVKVYCKKHKDTHTFDAGTATALIYTYQRTIAELYFAPAVAPVEGVMTEPLVLDSFCPKEDLKVFETTKVRAFKRLMGQHKRRTTLENRKGA